MVSLSHRQDGWRACASISAFTHTFLGWTGLRPALALHSREHHAMIQKRTRRRKSIDEIGVAEGASALAIGEVMAPDAVLYLIDPFHLSRAKWLNILRRSAHATVASNRNGSDSNSKIVDKVHSVVVLELGG